MASFCITFLFYLRALILYGFTSSHPPPLSSLFFFLFVLWVLCEPSFISPWTVTASLGPYELPSDFSPKGRFLGHKRQDVEGVGFNSRGPQRPDVKSDTPPPGSFRTDVPEPRYKEGEGFHRYSERDLSHQKDLIKSARCLVVSRVCFSLSFPPSHVAPGREHHGSPQVQGPGLCG